jgi:hypothetical protein
MTIFTQWLKRYVRCDELQAHQTLHPADEDLVFPLDTHSGDGYHGLHVQPRTVRSWASLLWAGQTNPCLVARSVLATVFQALAVSMPHAMPFRHRQRRVRNGKDATVGVASGLRCRNVTPLTDTQVMQWT